MNYIKKSLIFFLIWIVGWAGLSFMSKSDEGTSVRKASPTIVQKITSEIKDRKVAPQPTTTEPSTTETAYPSNAQIQIGASPILDVEVVQKEQDRVRGLSGREFLPLNRGMLFVFQQLGKHSFWMRNMKFPIDIMWIENSTIVHIEQNVPLAPIGVEDTNLPVYTPDVPANRVLEVSAGWVKTYNIKKGDTIVYNPHG